MEYEAIVKKETEKAFLVEPVNFEAEGDFFIPKTAVDNWIVAPWLCARKELNGSLTLLLPEKGVKGIEKIGMWDEDPAGNNGGAKVTNANLLSVPVKAIETEIEAEFGDDIDDLEDIGEGEPEPEMEEAAEQKDPFGEQAKKEIEKIKREQGQASNDEEAKEPEEKIDQDKLRELEAYIIPKEICDRIDEIGDVFEVCVDQSKEIVKRKFGKYKLTGAKKAELEQDIATFTAIQVLRRGY